VARSASCVSFTRAGLEQRARGGAVEAGVVARRQRVVAAGHLALGVVPQEGA
jgi:hypothetical protein